MQWIIIFIAVSVPRYHDRNIAVIGDNIFICKSGNRIISVCIEVPGERKFAGLGERVCICDLVEFFFKTRIQSDRSTVGLKRGLPVGESCGVVRRKVPSRKFETL